ncbi:hypothetical protein KJ780_00665, partial [Candidatus Micrarchaeota archaeon]|nr:hypothetical protein [Candidatus Micrarchaeota archaeon]
MDAQGCWKHISKDYIGKRSNVRIVVFALLLISISVAATYNYQGTSGPLSMQTTIGINPLVDCPANAQPGDTINVNMMLQSYYFGNAFSAILTSPLNPGYTNDGKVEQTSLNLIDSGSFATFYNYYLNCGYTDNGLAACGNTVGAGKMRCTDLVGSICGCTANPLSGEIVGRKSVVYDEVFTGTGGSGCTKHNGAADIGALCTGKWYVNGVEVADLGAGNINYQITIPPGYTKNTYNVSVQAKFKCLFAAKEIYGSHQSEIIMLYYNPGAGNEMISTVNISVHTYVGTDLTTSVVPNPPDKVEPGSYADVKVKNEGDVGCGETELEVKIYRCNEQNVG